MPNTINPFIALLGGNTSAEVINLLDQYSDVLLNASAYLEDYTEEPLFNKKDVQKTAEEVDQIRTSLREALYFIGGRHE